MKYTQLSRRSAGGKIDWEKQYLTFIPVEDAVFSWAERATSGHLEYSLNGGQTWVTIADGESTPTVTAGSKVIWRGDLTPITSISGGIGTFSATGNYSAYGNTMSLLFYDNYYGNQLDDVSTYKYVFRLLFDGDAHIITAPLLPATSLSLGCYSAMFHNCVNLVSTTELPAMSVPQNCYLNMFQGCSSLITAPRLPATILGMQCYQGMFYGCSSLTTAPELPATTLIIRCYYQMFLGCISLSYIKCLATDISASNCTTNWVDSVASTGTFVKAAEMEDWSTGASGIPSGWTVVDDNS